MILHGAWISHQEEGEGSSQTVQNGSHGGSAALPPTEAGQDPVEVEVEGEPQFLLNVPPPGPLGCVPV